MPEIQICRLSRFNFQVSFAVLLGEHNTTNHDDNAVRRAVRTYHAHPDYDTHTCFNDISLVRLWDPLVFCDYIRPVCLSRPRLRRVYHGKGKGRKVAEKLAGQTGYISGWGVQVSDRD